MKRKDIIDNRRNLMAHLVYLKVQSDLLWMAMQLAHGDDNAYWKANEAVNRNREDIYFYEEMIQNLGNRPWHTFEHRATHKYITAYDHLDSWVAIGKYRALNSVNFEEDWETAKSFIRVKVRSIFDDDQIARALYDNFADGCSCEHDCCGHWQTRTSDVKRVSKDNWIVWLSHYRNV